MSSDEGRHLEWRNVQAMIEAGTPALQRVSGKPEVVVFIDDGGARLGLRTLLVGEPLVVASPIAAISVETLRADGVTQIQLSTTVKPLFQEFYALLVEVADRIQLQGEQALQALGNVLSNWKALLRPIDRMPLDQRIGLFGELLILDRMLAVWGVAAARAWVGPAGEPHDFRVAETEFEIKTTTAHRRRHLISSLEQLQASQAHTLFLISVQLEAAGTGKGNTLPALVDQTRFRLGSSVVDRDWFEQALLTTWRYSDLHATHYSETFTLRSPIAMVLVNEDLPRITPELLVGVPHRQRIDDVQYRLDVDGLGWLDGTKEFHAVLPATEPAS